MLKQLVTISLLFLHSSSAFVAPSMPCAAGRSSLPLAVSMASDSNAQLSRRSLLQGGIAGAAIFGGNIVPALAEDAPAVDRFGPPGPIQTTESGVKFQILRTTTAPGDKFNIVETAKKGDLVITTILAKTKSGKVVMDTASTRQGFAITLGDGKVIQGLEDGIIGMKAGELRKLFIPAGPLTAPLKEDLEVEVSYERKSNLMKIFGFGG